MYLGPLDFLETGESQVCFGELIVVSEGLEMTERTGRMHFVGTRLLDTEIAVAAQRELKVKVRNVTAGWTAGTRLLARRDCWSPLAWV